MKTSRKIAIVGLGLASLLGSAQAAQTLVRTSNQSEIKATPAKISTTKKISRSQVGGIPLESYVPDYGMSPKEYGIRFGHGNKKGKINKLRLKQKAKLKYRQITR